MRPPAFWNDEDGARGSGALTRALLSPLSAIYAWTVARRIARTTPADPGIPVICVGNITLGGTGKTPVSAALLDMLQGDGIEAHALSRGYGGRLKGPLRVDPALHEAADVGDELLLLARAAPAWISRDRPAGAVAAREAGAQAIVMDDGHQNPSLLKTLSFVVVDGEAGWGARQVFPAGPLREPVETGLARADAVIVMTSGESETPNYDRLGLADLEKPVFHAWLAPLAAPPSGPLMAFAGIGRPQKFYDGLVAAGGQLAETASFPDHHPFRPGELQELGEIAARHEARLITTEKDWVRLPPAWRDQATPFPVAARFANPAALAGLLRDVMDGAARGR